LLGDHLAQDVALGRIEDVQRGAAVAEADRAIAPAALGFVQRSVGEVVRAGDEIGPRQVDVADADGRTHQRRAQFFLQTSDRRGGGFRIGFGENQGKLVAADAVAAVLGAQPAHPFADLRQHGVAVRVSALVVNLLEVIDVDERQRQRMIVSRGAGALAGEVLVERALIAELGEIVGQRRGRQRLDRRRRGRECREAVQTKKSDQTGHQCNARDRRTDDEPLVVMRPARRAVPEAGQAADTDCNDDREHQPEVRLRDVEPFEELRSAGRSGCSSLAVGGANEAGEAGAERRGGHGTAAYHGAVTPQ